MRSRKLIGRLTQDSCETTNRSGSEVALERLLFLLVLANRGNASIKFNYCCSKRVSHCVVRVPLSCPLLLSLPPKFLTTLRQLLILGSRGPRKPLVTRDPRYDTAAVRASGVSRINFEFFILNSR